MNTKIATKEKLIEASLGITPADVLIKNGTLVNVLTREAYTADVVIYGNRIAATGKNGCRIGPDTTIIDAEGKYLIPGLIDPHMHIESSGITVTELAKQIVPRGVISVVEDPHEFANVLGIEGVQLFREEASRLPIRFFIRVPGHVPAMPPEIETSGAELTVEQTRQMLDWEDSLQLAGDINYNLILSRDPEQLEKIRYCEEKHKTVGGQAPSLKDEQLNAFVCGGPEDSHVSANLEEVMDIQRHGLKAILTPKPFLFSPKDYGKLAALIREKNIDTRNIMFCTDDRQAHYVYEDGHLDCIVRQAIASGIEPLTAIQMATINVAEHLRIDRDFGSIAPGKIADIVILDDLNALRAGMVLVDGQIAAKNGSLIDSIAPFSYPKWAKDTVHLAKTITAEDMKLRTKTKRGTAECRVLIAGVPKRCAVEKLEIADGCVMPDESRDILCMSVLERHKGSGNIGRAFLKGTGIRNGAIAGSSSHDAHNIYVIGTSHEYMAMAANRVAEMKGGYAAVINGEIVAQLALPIGGLISDRPLEEVARQYKKLEQKILREDMGCTLQGYPLFTLSVISLPNIPHWGITDKGLIEVATMAHKDTILTETSQE